jgi:hypothetical protein
MSSRTPKGYPEIKWDGRKHLTQRLVSGIPAHLCIRHTCDNPPCMNPSHWLFGTNKDNVNDRRARGRQYLGVRRGEANGWAKLTKKEVLEIRRLYELRARTYLQLAEDFGISDVTVHRIVKRLAWKHV